MKLFLFRVDTNIFTSDNHDNYLDSLIYGINIEITKISKWFKINKLSLNIKKQLHDNKRKRKGDNLLIEQAAETKFLGVIITENLTWDDHNKTVCNKVRNFGIGIIRKICHLIPLSILLNLYFTLVHPYFEFCYIAWT